MPINSSTIALTTQRRLNAATKAVSDSSERLASGLRINRASDDAAGLAISTSLAVGARVFNQGVRNLNDGISAINIASSTVSDLVTVITRLKELSQQAANGTYGRTQRLAVDKEGEALTNEFNRLVGGTSFNGLKLLDQSTGAIRFQSGFGLDGGIEGTFAAHLKRTVNSGTFQSASTLGAPAEGYNTAVQRVADVNGDGKADILQLTFSSGTITLLKSNGDGTFTSSTVASGIGGPSSFEVADLDGDGKQDVVFLDYSSGTLSVGRHYGNGDGTFGTKQVTQIDGNVDGSDYGFKIGDFNGDGRKDLFLNYTDAVGNYVSRIFSSTGSRSYTTINSGLLTNEIDDLGSAQVGDFNGDGRDDLTSGASGYSYLSDSTGKFGSRTLSDFSGGVPYLADVNYDGVLDAIGVLSGSIGVQFGRGDGTFGAATTTTSSSIGGNGIFGLRDLNGDGRLDLVDFATLSGTVSVFSLGSDGKATLLSSAALGLFDSFVDLGDVDGNGTLDIISQTNSNTRLRFGNGVSTSTIKRTSLLTASNARGALDYFDTLLTSLTNEQGSLGSLQSRLGAALSTVGAQAQEFRSAEGRIVDVDVASESANLTRNSILREIGASIAAQANQSGRLALDLLRG